MFSCIKRCLNKQNRLRRKGQTCSQYSDEFLATPADNLQWNICDQLVKSDKKFFVESHRKSKHHQVGLQRKCRSVGKKTFLLPDQLNFREKVASSFLAADILLDKLNHPALKSLFATMGKVLPSETAARASVAELAS